MKAGRNALTIELVLKLNQLFLEKRYKVARLQIELWLILTGNIVTTSLQASYYLRVI